MNDPLVIKKGSTVIDACDKLHKEFVKNFRHAKIWGTSVKFPGQKVGPDHVLEDEDVLRIILKEIIVSNMNQVNFLKWNSMCWKKLIS